MPLVDGPLFFSEQLVRLIKDCLEVLWEWAVPVESYGIIKTIYYIKVARQKTMPNLNIN